MIWLGFLIIVTVQGLTLWLLWSHLQVMQRVQKALQVWDSPEHLTTPAPEAGTMWVPSDREAAALEEQLRKESEQRSPSGSRRLKKVSPQPAA